MRSFAVACRHCCSPTSVPGLHPPLRPSSGLVRSPPSLLPPSQDSMFPTSRKPSDLVRFGSVVQPSPATGVWWAGGTRGRRGGEGRGYGGKLCGEGHGLRGKA